jgi:hypothetical protein
VLPAQGIDDHQRLYGLSEPDLVRNQVADMGVPKDSTDRCNLVRQRISGDPKRAAQTYIER